MVQLFFSIWNRLSGECDLETAERVYRDVVGSLFFQRYVMCGLNDPCGYGILDEHPDKALHDRLGAISTVLGSIGYGRLIGEEQRYMMQFNQFISDMMPTVDNMLMIFADGTLVAKNRSERIAVPKKLYKQSLCVYGRLLGNKRT